MACRTLEPIPTNAAGEAVDSGEAVTFFEQAFVAVPQRAADDEQDRHEQARAAIPTS